MPTKIKNPNLEPLSQYEITDMHVIFVPPRAVRIQCLARDQNKKPVRLQLDMERQTIERACIAGLGLQKPSKKPAPKR